MSAYLYQALWKRLDDALRGEIIAFWLEHGALTDAAAARARVDEIVAVARTGTGAIAGVCTAAPRLVPDLGRTLYYYRTFIAPAHRDGFIVRRLLTVAVAALEGYSRDHPDDAADGVYIELENPLFSEHLRYAVWPRKGLEFVYIGKTPTGHERRLLWFRHTQIS